MPNLPALVSRIPWSNATAIAALVMMCWLTVPKPARSETATTPASGFSFALIGDLGYFPPEEPWLDNVFADLNRDRSLAFVVHLGDLSSPRYGCTDELLNKRLAQFQASLHPLVYTPGDNDWTDCLEPNVQGTDPLTRLARVRALFFAGDHSLGQASFALTSQSQTGIPEFAKYRENLGWDLGGVTFVTLHVTGSNNGLGRTPEGDAEYRERNQANLAWLRQGFERAKANQSQAILIMQQANLFPEFAPFPGTAQIPSGYTDLREALRQESSAFGKPVVLVHGDSHYFRVDMPLGPRPVRGLEVKPALENFTRVETFGSPYHHWVEVRVDPSDPNVFSFRPRLVTANLSPRP